jgi:nitrogen fixation protein FixH
MNWGVKLIIVNAAFVVFMLGMVYLCTRQHYDLVSDDYYARELKYQEVIDGKNNLVALGASVAVNMTGEQVTVRLPDAAGMADKGKVVFYKPDNAANDVEMDLSGKREVVLEKSKLAAGLYKVQITWQRGDKGYFEEKSLFVQ